MDCLAFTVLRAKGAAENSCDGLDLRRRGVIGIGSRALVQSPRLVPFLPRAPPNCWDRLTGLVPVGPRCCARGMIPAGGARIRSPCPRLDRRHRILRVETCPTSDIKMAWIACVRRGISQIVGSAHQTIDRRLRASSSLRRRERNRPQPSEARHRSSDEQIFATPCRCHEIAKNLSKGLRVRRGCSRRYTYLGGFLP